MPTEQARPRAVIAFEAMVAVTAALALAAVAVLAVGEHTPLSVTIVVTALAAPVLARFTISVERQSQDVTVTFESVSLVFLLLVTTPAIALALWSAFIPFGLIRGLRRWRVHLFNVGIAILCGSALTLSVLAFGRPDPQRPITLLAVAVGCSVSTLIDLALSWVHVHLRTGRPIRSMMSLEDVIVGSGVLGGTASLGYLGALLAQLGRPWVMLVLLVPVAAVIVASSATRRSLDDQRRLSVLLESSRDRRDLEDSDEILASAARHARVLLGSESVQLSADPPTRGEIGAPIEYHDGAVSWLVSAPRRDRDSWLASERQALDTLAADTAESLARARLIAELRVLARIDPLSGLANRATFTAEVAKALRACDRGEATPVLLYLDLDNFKLVNDWYGHHIGDELVRQVAARVVAAVPDEALAARLGGDEFAVLLPSCDGDGGLAGICRRLIDTLRQEYLIEGHSVMVGVSVGMAHLHPSMSVEDALRNADMAMYHAKTDPSGGPAVYHEGLREASDQRSRLKADLAHAADQGQLRVLYQPVFDLRTGMVDGVEALVRWEHPTHGLLPAGAFVDVAEESGLIRSVGAWVLRQAMTDAAAMARAAGRPLSLAVNVSPRQLGDDALTHLVAELVAADTSGTHLVLELTESAVITEDPEVIARMQRLVDAGASLALDDFGVGYSSVGYLRWLPMRILKLDRSLLTTIGEDARARSLVEALLVMGEALGLVVVAEGIERAVQARVLTELGCQLGQGWALSGPIPLADLERLLARAPRPVS